MHQPSDSSSHPCPQPVTARTSHNLPILSLNSLPPLLAPCTPPSPLSQRPPCGSLSTRHALTPCSSPSLPAPAPLNLPPPAILTPPYPSLPTHSLPTGPNHPSTPTPLSIRAPLAPPTPHSHPSPPTRSHPCMLPSIHLIQPSPLYLYMQTAANESKH